MIWIIWFTEILSLLVNNELKRDVKKGVMTPELVTKISILTILHGKINLEKKFENIPLF